MGNGTVENFNKTTKNLLKKDAAEKENKRPIMFAVTDLPISMRDSRNGVLICSLLNHMVSNDLERP